MTKKKYMKPATQVVRIQHQHMICVSTNGMNNTLQSTEVNSAWSRGSHSFDDEE
jgi:hypothetical protein